MHAADLVNDREVHVWQIHLGDSRWDVFGAVLSSDEREKAARFRTLKLQHAYRRCRSALRVLLSRHSSRAPEDIVFSYGQYGKPEIIDHPLHFNLSHSGGVALIALSPYPVGIDIESTNRPDISIDELLDIVCHPAERAALALLPPAGRQQRFYQLWTQKEAYCKALGVGLQHPLTSIRMEAFSSSSVWQVRDEQILHAAPFYAHDLNIPDGYAGTVCMPFSDARISLFGADDVNQILDK